jgi:hypothetical protein
MWSRKSTGNCAKNLSICLRAFCGVIELEQMGKLLILHTGGMWKFWRTMMDMAQ